jgi:hypothetical protein
MQHDWSHKSALSPMHRRKSLHERLRSPPSDCHETLLSLQSMYPSSILALPTSLHKSRDDISIKGETKTLINVIRMIICANTIANQTTKLKNNKI